MVKEDGITASGGWCAPPSPSYDYMGMLFPWKENPEPLDLPFFKVSRGGIPFNTATKNPKQDRFLTMAMGVALGSNCKFRHGAIVVKHGKVLGAASNCQKNDPKYIDYKYSQIHAEIGALKKAGWPMKATVFVARINGKGESRLSKPCANCQEVLNAYRCKVVWTR